MVVKGSNGYCYVSALDVSGSGDSGVWAHNEDERGLSEELWLNANGTTSENFMAFAASSRAAIETRALGTSDNPQGEVTYPVILVNFSDVSFSITNAVDTFNRQFNEKGFSGGGAAGSVRDYFVAQSRGKYSPSFDVVCEVTLSSAFIFTICFSVFRVSMSNQPIKFFSYALYPIGTVPFFQYCP